VITAVVVVAFAYVAFTVLAPWQLGKNHDTNEFNDRLRAGLEADPVPASDVLPGGRFQRRGGEGMDQRRDAGAVPRR
jgi:cytochrome oxidase assembly protein ShyY1